MTKIERLLKYAAGEKVVKFLQGGTIREQEEEMLDEAFLNALKLTNPLQRLQMLNEVRQQQLLLNPTAIESIATYLPQTKVLPDMSGLSFNRESGKVEGDVKITETEVNPEEYFDNAIPAEQSTNKQPKKKSLPSLSATGQAALGITSQIGSEIIQGVDQAVMGDKNFSASSLAIDAGVHGVSSKLMKSGNPYAAAAGLALEGLNFVTKAAGKNVQGYDVNINNSGYGTLGHMESEAGRIWDNWNGNTARKLRKRNEQARMALAAADISEDISYEQEARTNSVTNVLQLNQIALAGGIDSSLLGN